MAQRRGEPTPQPPAPETPAQAIERLTAENVELKKTIASLRKERTDLRRELKGVKARLDALEASQSRPAASTEPTPAPTPEPTPAQDQARTDEQERLETIERLQRNYRFTPRARTAEAPAAVTPTVIHALGLDRMQEFELARGPRRQEGLPENLQAYYDFIHASFVHLLERSSRERGTDAMRADEYHQAIENWTNTEGHAFEQLGEQLRVRYTEQGLSGANLEQAIREELVRNKIVVINAVVDSLNRKIIQERKGFWSHLPILHNWIDGKLTHPLHYDKNLIKEMGRYTEDIDIRGEVNRLVRTEDGQQRLMDLINALIMRSLEMTRRTGMAVSPSDLDKPRWVWGLWKADQKQEDVRYAKLYNAAIAAFTQLIAQEGSQEGTSITNVIVSRERQLHESANRNMSWLPDMFTRKPWYRWAEVALVAGLATVVVGTEMAKHNEASANAEAERLARATRTTQSVVREKREARHEREALQAAAKRTADSIKAQAGEGLTKADAGSVTEQGAQSAEDAKQTADQAKALQELLAFDPSLKAEGDSSEKIAIKAFKEIVGKSWGGANKAPGSIGLGNHKDANPDAYKDVDYYRLMEDVRTILGDKKCQELSARFYVGISGEEAFGVIRNLLDAYRQDNK